MTNKKNIMRNIEFYKLQGSGNDFILIDARYLMRTARVNYKKLAKRYCERKAGIGADGLLIIEPSRIVNFKMRIFNPDGSEPSMCGNGARCAALWAQITKKRSIRGTKTREKVDMIRFETTAGFIEAEVNSNEVKVKMPKPHSARMDIPLTVLGRKIHVHFINTGVPHTIVFSEGLKQIDVDTIGRAIRFHKKFAPRGTNVDFVEYIDEKTIKIRTYERGVESETLACGTGAVASALVAAYKGGASAVSGKKIFKVHTKSGEVLKVYFEGFKNEIEDVWLQGNAYCVYKGIISNAELR